ncbi:MAG: hypothetical protein GC161_18565 [Planctomycetaceae bacterium]|nr:hypothetical protein [Planctomycetaceae bacterium]
MCYLHVLVCAAVLGLPAAASQSSHPVLPRGQLTAAVGAGPAGLPVVVDPGSVVARATVPRSVAASTDVLVRGFVWDEHRGPATGGLVFSERGGIARVAEDGSFELAVASVPFGPSLRLTAVGSGGGLAQSAVQLDAAGAPLSPVVLQLVSGATCSPEWLPTFEEGYGDPNEAVFALEVFDDGSGPALYVGGGFTSIGTEPIYSAARFDGEGWEQVGDPLGWILDFATYDSGSGPELYAAGALEGGIVRWDGVDWQPLPGEYGGIFECLQVFDDGMGRGPMLYGGGYQALADNEYRAFAVRTDGMVVEEFGFDALASADVFNRVACMEVYDAGTGPELYIGGRFELNTVTPARNLVVWKGGSIHAVDWASAAPFTGSQFVYDMHWWQREGVSILVVAGNLANFPDLAQATYVQYDGTAWSDLLSGGGVEGYAVTSFDAGDGAGNCLVINGNFGSINGQTCNGSARISPTAVEPMGTEFPFIVRDSVGFDDGVGMRLYVGIYPNEPTSFGYSMLRWEPSVWFPVQLDGTAPNGSVLDLLVHDDGSGPALYAAGSFTAVGGVAANRVARYNGIGWSAVGSGLTGTVHDLETFETQNGLRLVAGGNFSIPNGGQNLAAWDGASWGPLGPSLPGPLYALRAVDGAWIGAGQALDRLYVAGSFSFVVSGGGGGGGGGGGVVNNLSYLTANNQWVRVGDGLNAAGRSLALHSEAGVHSLFVGGDFTQAGMQSANRVARLQLAAFIGGSGDQGNGLWSVLGSGIDGPVRSLAVFDDGSGARLYAGGQFTAAGGAAAQNVASFADGTWQAPAGLTGPAAVVERLHVHDDGSGPALYAGGDFDFAGGVAADGVARFDGVSWSVLGGGLGGTGRALASFATSAAPAQLFVGGNFASQPDTGDRNLARWSCVPASMFVASAGCSGNPNVLDAQCSALSVGQSCQLTLTSPDPQGIALLYLGSLGVDGGGCGVFVPGLGELLLSIGLPTAGLGVAPSVAGVAQFSLGVPNNPGFVGIAVAFQAAHVATALPGLPIGMSNAISTQIAP